MATTPFQNKDTGYAYHSIHDFFDNYGLRGAVQELERILKAAVSSKPCKVKEPCQVLYFMENLGELCRAAFMLHSNYDTGGDAILKQPDNGEPDMLQPQNFVGRQAPGTVWHYFPRSLTAGQYHDPGKAIRKFAEYMPAGQWEAVLKEITEFALSRRSILDNAYCHNILTIRRRLLQLVEGCHLLQLRTGIKHATAGDIQQT